MANQDYYLPRGSRILVTGANGFVGSNVVYNLLELGFKVRGTVRSEKPWLDEMFQGEFGQDAYESVVLANFENVDTLVEVMEGVSGVAHVASDVSFSSNPEEVVPWVVRAVDNLLEAASRHCDIQRVVMTSSSIAALFPEPNREGIVVHEDSFNDEAIKQAYNPDTPEHLKGLFTYAASKTEGEKAAWKWMENNKPNFQFNTVLPDFTVSSFLRWQIQKDGINSNKLGRILHEEIAGSTIGYVRGLTKGNADSFGSFMPQYFCDVIDIARLHAAALLDPNTVSRRLFGFTAPVNLTDMISAIRKLRPDNTLIPDTPVNEGRDLSKILPAKEAENLLREFWGREGWTPLEESIAQGIEGH
ncbi:NAD-dependent epimerase/dehydratase [Penicillium coprophilum]|uniref:NAD-dependent epimerase/dehydratase n=1 Tax=Penicillium coprophilum TaxID=36646 RepID=UPI00239B0A7A|nr:NAD-dependent epimerase/dehydratase [Penicillium coprophilum]KAJ5153673.1 NAD-dependent epimerase/dehydratase [Penicillium coprophilum]